MGQSIRLFISLIFLLSASAGFGAYNQLGVGAIVDRSNHINNGLNMYMLFNEGTGDTVFDMCNEYDGTLSNMVPASDWVSGEYGMALDFDGSNDHITIPSNWFDFDEETHFTISAWIYMDSGQSANRVLYTSAAGSTGRFIWYAHHTTSGNQRIYVQSTGELFVSNTNVDDNQWHHVALTRDVNDFVIYLDGVADGNHSESCSVTNNPTQNFIGRRDGGDYFKGMISNFRIYGRALSPDEIMILSQEYYVGVVNDPVVDLVGLPRIAIGEAAPTNPPRQRRVINWQWQ